MTSYSKEVIRDLASGAAALAADAADHERLQG